MTFRSRTDSYIIDLHFSPCLVQAIGPCMPGCRGDLQIIMVWVRWNHIMWRLQTLSPWDLGRGGSVALAPSYDPVVKPLFLWMTSRDFLHRLTGLKRETWGAVLTHTLLPRMVVGCFLMCDKELTPGREVYDEASF